VELGREGDQPRLVLGLSRGGSPFDLECDGGQGLTGLVVNSSCSMYEPSLDAK